MLVRLTDDSRSTPWTWTPDGQSLLVRRPGQVVDRQQLFELWELSTRADSRDDVQGGDLSRGDLSRGDLRRLAENALYPAVSGTEVAYLRYVERDRWEVVVTDRTTGQSAELGAAQWNVPPRWVGGPWQLAPISSTRATSSVMSCGVPIRPAP